MQKMYDQHKTTIKKISSKFAAKTGIDREDLECEGNLIFCECIEKYDSSQGEFSKYLTSALYFSLNQYIRKEYKYRDHVEGSDINEIINLDSENSSGFKHNMTLYKNIDKLSINENILESVNLDVLSEDSKYVYKVILSPDVKIGENKITKKNLREYLKSNGWNWSRIENSFRELTLVVNC